MRVRVRFFAALREAVGQEELFLDLPPGSSPDGVWSQLLAENPGLGPFRPNLAAAVNRRYSPFTAELHEGDEVVFIPPVSGG